MNRLQKQELIEEIQTIFSNNKSIIVVQYKGLTVADLENLRKQVRGSDIGFKVIKNSLASRAAKETDNTMLTEFLVGPTAIVYGKDDPVSSAKILSEFASKNPALSLVGGIYNGDRLSLTDIKTLSTLPSFDEIRGKLVGTISAVARNIMFITRTPATNVIGVLKAYSEK